MSYVLRHQLSDYGHHICDPGPTLKLNAPLLIALLDRRDELRGDVPDNTNATAWNLLAKMAGNGNALAAGALDRIRTELKG